MAAIAPEPSDPALLRTTTAITVIRGGDKDNVVPAEAEALVNFRLLPGETAAGVTAYIRTVMKVRFYEMLIRHAAGQQE